MGFRGLHLLLFGAVALIVPRLALATPDLSSANFSLTLGGGTPITFNSLAPGDGESGTIPNCVSDGETTCQYSFSLTATAFSFTEKCGMDSLNCDFPMVQLELTSLVFPSQTLTNVTLSENAGECTDLDCMPDPPYGSIASTPTSATLSVAAFELFSGNSQVMETATFVTTTATAVPEPASLALLVVGIGGLAWHLRRKIRQS